MKREVINLDAVEKVCVKAIINDLAALDRAQENLNKEREAVNKTIAEVQARIEINHGMEPGSLTTTHQIQGDCIVQVEKKIEAVKPNDEDEADFTAVAV